MEKEYDELQKMNMCCFYLINHCIESNAETMTVAQKNVTHQGKSVGTWEITIKKARPKAPKQ